MAFSGMWRVVETGLVHLLPGDFLAGVAGELAHDGDECAPGHVITVIEAIAGADRGEQPVMLDLIRVTLALPTPVGFAPDAAGFDGGFAFTAEDDARVLVVTASAGAAKGADAHAV